jgi:hypothetical protein
VLDLGTCAIGPDDDRWHRHDRGVDGHNGPGDGQQEGFCWSSNVRPRCGLQRRGVCGVDLGRGGCGGSTHWTGDEAWAAGGGLRGGDWGEKLRPEITGAGAEEMTGGGARTEDTEGGGGAWTVGAWTVGARGRGNGSCRPTDLSQSSLNAAANGVQGGGGGGATVHL